MKIFQIIFLVVLIIPFAEIYLLLQVGSVIGAFSTIFLVVFTAALGAWLLRQQGFSTLDFQTFGLCDSAKRSVVRAYCLTIESYHEVNRCLTRDITQ